MEQKKSKPWYTSKTVWFNVVTVLGSIAGGLGGILPILEPFLAPKVFAWVLAGVGIINLVLRSITKDAVWFTTKD